MSPPRYALDHLERRERGEVIARIGVSCVLYCDATMDRFGRAAADVFEAFQAFVPPGSLDSRWATAGWVALTPRAVNAHLKELRSATATWEGFSSLYFGQGSPPGAVGTHAFEVNGRAPPDMSYVRLEWPLDVFERVTPNELVDFLAWAAGHLPLWSGHAGLALRYNYSRGRVHGEILPGLLGIDAGNPESVKHRFVDWNRVDEKFEPIDRDRTLAVRWLSFLSATLVDRTAHRLAHGSREAFRSSLPAGVEVRVIGDGGLLLRAAEHPPVGDLASGATDLAYLPDLSRHLAPTRLSGAVPGVGRKVDTRLDDVPSAPVPPWPPSGTDPPRDYLKEMPVQKKKPAKKPAAKKPAKKPAAKKPAAKKPAAAKPAAKASKADSKALAADYFTRGEKLLDERELFVGFQWLSLAAEAGHKKAASWLELMEEHEQVSPEEVVEAYLDLAEWYRKGDEVPVDPAARKHWLEQAAEAGSDEAERLLAKL